MKNKKYPLILGGIIIIVIVLIIFQVYLNNETKKLKEESKIYSTLEIKTKENETITTEYYNFDDGSFFIKIPKNFTILSEELKKIKYPNANPPTYVYSNKETTINVAVQLTDNKMSDNEIKAYLNTIKKEFSSSFKIINSTTFKRSQRTIGKIEFISHGVDTDIYNNMIVFTDKNLLRIVTFNCTKALQDTWQEVGNFITDSIMFPVEK